MSTATRILLPGPSAMESETTAPSGELRLHEFSFRAGLLLGALLFLRDAMGWPWDRSLFGFICGALLAAVIVLTLVFRWRILGDWRRRSNQALYAGLAATLTIPLSAALSPTLGTSAMPDFLEVPVVQIMEATGQIPGVAFILGVMRAFLSFILLAITLIVLLAGGRGGGRGALFVAAGMITLVCLFFHPVAQTFAGFVFLGVFLYIQWEIALLIPDRLRGHLGASQIRYLRELVREGSLPTGDTRVMLGNDPALFGGLLEFQLVQYDAIAREVVPGARLRSGGAESTVETAFAWGSRGAWIAIGLIYFVMPDFLPGPIDDMIVMAICAFGGLNVAGLLGKATRL